MRSRVDRQGRASSHTLFDAAAGRYNRGHNRRVHALGVVGVNLGITIMEEQQNLAGKRIGIKPSYLVVPPELEFPPSK